jgi:hypothetical protein
MKLTSTGVYRINTKTDPAKTLTGSPLRNLTRTGGDPHNDFIIGAFTHADGRRAVVIVNHSYSFTAWPTVEFDADEKDVVEVDKTSGKEISATDDSPELKGFQMSLGAGDCRLFLLPAAQ